MSVCLGCTGVVAERSAASTLGISRRLLRSLVADDVLVRIRRGVLVGACVVARARTDPLLDHRIRLEAVLLVYDDCVASHESAAVVHGLPVLDLPQHVIATRVRGAWRGGADLRVRTAPLPESHLARVDGCAVTSLARTAVDVARTSSLRAALVTGDIALRRCGRAAVQAALDDSSAWADLGRARRAIALFDGRSESPLESASRAIFVEHSLPAPELQVEFKPEPGLAYRADFFWRSARVIGEADGMGKYESPGALRAEPFPLIFAQATTKPGVSRNTPQKVVAKTKISGNGSDVDDLVALMAARSARCLRVELLVVAQRGREEGDAD
ncbi:MAG TPA: hypothetical protein VHD58_07050, partial [Mycobacteriales bacterium]|nr:hypothetical protein [Mycobacteriales bacterium]